MSKKHIKVSSTQKLPKLYMDSGLVYKPNIAAKRFRNVEQYLKWIAKSGNLLPNKDPGAKYKQELLLSVVGKIVENVYVDNLDVAARFELGGVLERNAGCLEKIGEDTYRVRLAIKQPAIKNAVEMVIGHFHDVPKGKAMLTLNKSIPGTERAAIGRMYTGWLKNDHVIAPVKVANWASPVIIKALKSINQQIVGHYHVTCVIMQTIVGLEVVLTFTSTDNKQVFSSKIIFDTIVHMDTLPKQFLLHCFPKKARDMLSKIKFQPTDAILSTPLSCKTPLPGWYTDGSLMELPKLERIRRMSVVADNQVTSGGAKVLTRSKTMIIGGGKPPEELFWDIDYNRVEQSVYDRVKLQAQFITIQEAFKLYDTLAQTKHNLIPALNQHMKRSISLYMYEELGDRTDQKFVATFILLLNYVCSCIQCSYCPYLCQPHVNAMTSEDIGDDVKIRDDVRSLQKLLKLIKGKKLIDLIEMIDIY